MAHPTGKLRPNPSNLATKEAQYAKGGGYTKFWRQVDVGKFPGFSRSFKVILKYLHETVQTGGKGGSFPGFRTMARHTGADPMTCQRAVKFFVKHGLLSVKAGNPALSNEYTLLKSPLSLFVKRTQIAHSPCTQIAHSPCTQIAHLMVTNIERLKVEGGAAAPTSAGVDVGTGERTGEDGRTYLPPIALTPLPSTAKTPFNASGAPGASSDLFRADYAAPARQAASPKGLAEAEAVWDHMMEIDKDLPGLSNSDKKFLQNKINVKGYGVDKMMKAATVVARQWSSVKQNLKIKDGTTMLQVLVWKTDALLNFTQFLGRGSQWASPDIAEEAKKAVAIQRAERMAAKLLLNKQA